MQSNPANKIELLQALADPEGVDESEYRFLVGGKHVKYVTIAPGLFAGDDLTFAPVLIPMLPPFPPGDWNKGYICKNDSGSIGFSTTGRRDLAGVVNAWHATRIDQLELHAVERLRQNIYKVTHPQFERPVVVKFAAFPWQIQFLEAETTAYQWVQGQGVGPEFLGHVTEEGRVTGFLIESIDNSRAADGRAEDLRACQQVLGKLHGLGVKHGDINKFNFLIKEDGSAVIVDFENARKGCSGQDLKEEYEHLEESLNDPSYRGGIEPEELCDDESEQ